ncbi:hypothetical protein [Aquimarina sp. LLG6339-5]|uniref:hypothetical protein n=1 Tax=Aquimarina sp. LLG6339-5 TaxID=3160830 RepID=UPI0038638FD0
MGRATFDNFQDKFLTIEFPTVVEPFPWDVTRDGEDITFTLGAGEDEKSEVHKTTDVRKFLLENFNWNGIVHFMHLLSDKNDDFTYTRPTDLKGIPADDDILIIPDEATEAIIYEQAKYAIETTYADAPADNIDKILKYVDGKAKTGFSSDTLETTYDDLIKESDNSEMSYNGTSFSMPDLSTVSDKELYDFLKNLSQSRYGLWSEENNVTNFVSIRRVLDTSKSKYNDTLFLAWKESGSAKVAQYIGSTEPGKLGDSGNGQLLPQTTTVLLGVHKSITSGKSTPGGRTRNAYRKANGGANHYFLKGDTSMNVHYGHPDINVIPQGYGIHNNSTAKGYNNDEIEAYLLVVRVYNILTKWGIGKNESISCYKNLENNTKTLSVSNVLGEKEVDKKVNIVRDTDDVVKTIMYSTYKSYVSKNYKVTGKKATDAIRKDRANKLLMNYHNRANDGAPRDCYSGYELKDLLEELKQDRIFKSIVETQLEYESNLKKVDAQPGGGTIKKIEKTQEQKKKDKEKFDEITKEAKDDYKVLSELFNKWNGNTILSNEKETFNGNQISLLEYFKKHIKSNEQDFNPNSVQDVDNSGGKGIDKKVGGWSQGCQIILGGHNFYQFLNNLTQFIEDSSQERWYYTIVDSENITSTSSNNTDSNNNSNSLNE